MEKMQECLYFTIKEQQADSVPQRPGSLHRPGHCCWAFNSSQGGCRAVGCRMLLGSASGKWSLLCSPVHSESAPYFFDYGLLGSPSLTSTCEWAYWLNSEATDWLYGPFLAIVDLCNSNKYGDLILAHTMLEASTRKWVRVGCYRQIHC